MIHPGDVVSRRKGIFMHRGIMLEDGRVLHNTPFKGRHASSIDEFSKDKTVYASRHGSDIRDRTLVNLENDERDRYNPFTNNCEHTVTRATKNEASSPQLRGWVMGAAFAAVGFAITRHPGVAIAGFALGKRLGSRGELA